MAIAKDIECIERKKQLQQENELESLSIDSIQPCQQEHEQGSNNKMLHRIMRYK